MKNFPTAPSRLSLEAHAQKLHRIAHQMIASRMRNEGLIGAALDGSLATGRIWETSDVDFSVFPTQSEHNQSVEWRVCFDVLIHVHVTSKRATDDLMGNYPQSFIESANSGYFTADPTWFLDGLAVMSIVDDPTGYLAEVKQFVSQHRFAPEVLQERLRLMMKYVDEKIEEAEKAMTQGNHGAFLSLLYDKNGLVCSMAHMWLEAHNRIYSGKEQDWQLAYVSQEAKLPQVHELYRATLGLNHPNRVIEKILHPIGEYATLIDEIFQVFEESFVEQNKSEDSDQMEIPGPNRLWVELSFKSIPIAFQKGCLAHIAFVINQFGPGFIDQLIESQKRIDPSRVEAVEAKTRKAKAVIAEVWQLFGYIEWDDAKMGHQLDSAIRLAEITKRRL